MTRPLARCLAFCVSLLAAAPGARADDVERALSAQSKPAKQEVRVDRSVGEAAHASREGVAARATAREEARLRDLSRAPDRAPAESGAAAQASSGSTGSRFLCQYRCTNAKFLGADKTTLSVAVTAGNERAAIDQAVSHAGKTCHRQTQRVFEHGSASCRKQQD